MTYELRHNPDAPTGVFGTILYERDWHGLTTPVERFGSLQEAMLSLAARGMAVGEEGRVPPFEYGSRRYVNVRRWEVAP